MSVSPSRMTVNSSSVAVVGSTVKRMSSLERTVTESEQGMNRSPGRDKITWPASFVSMEGVVRIGEKKGEEERRESALPSKLQLVAWIQREEVREVSEDGVDGGKEVIWSVESAQRMLRRSDGKFVKEGLLPWNVQSVI